MYRTRPLLAVVAGLALATAVRAETPARTAAGPHTSLELIAGRPTLGEVWVGLRFRLDPEWHVYWRNPGDSGAPPRVEWMQLPAGWSPGEIRWPAPERIPLGPLTNYGYHGEVVLPIRMKVAAGARTRAAADAGAAAPLVADVRWIVCRDVCIPGRATVGLTPGTASPGEVREWSAALARARAQAPRPAPKTWTASARADAEGFTIAVAMDRAPGDAAFFPVEESQLEDSGPQQVSVSGRQVRFRFRKSPQLTGVPGTIRGVVRLGSGEAFDVAAPVDGATPRNTTTSKKGSTP